MKRELGIARCGLACCLCSENVKCGGCSSGECPDKDWCENSKCSRENGITNCFLCESDCKKGLLAKIKPYGFTLFVKRYGVEDLLDCLERNEKNGVVYHREGINGDYDDFDDVEELIEFIKTGRRRKLESDMDWINKVSTPCYVIDERRLRENLEILKDVRERSGCKILLAQKAYSAFATYPLIAGYLDGCTASGLYEARLGYEEMAKPFGRENHIFSPAYRDEEFDEIAKICGHIIFNNAWQFEKFKDRAKGASCGIRINPEYSTQEHGIYDPCGEFSRLGTTAGALSELPEGIEGLHFHTLCEQDADALVETLAAAEDKFGKFFGRIKWLNMGGGHHITRADYDREMLIGTVKKLREKYGFEVYLEPGEAVALNAGYLVTTVLDTFKNGMDIAITDASAACHMPDVLEMPYRPNIQGSGLPNEKAFTYRLGGNTCLAGDIIGDYSFDSALSEGDRLVFEDMAIYSMCKNNTFNGIPLPSIYLLRGNGEPELLKKFGYGDFKGRLS